MKKITSLWLCCCMAFAVLAQTPEQYLALAEKGDKNADYTLVLEKVELGLNQLMGKNDLKKTWRIYTALLSLKGKALNELGKFKQAQPLLLQADSIVQKRLPETDSLAVAIKSHLIINYAFMLQYDKFFPLANHIFENRHKHTPSVSLARVMDNLGSYYGDKMDFEKSDLYFSEAAKIREIVAKKNPIQKAYIYNWYSISNRMKNKLSQAVADAEEALKIVDAYGGNDLLRANIYNNMASAYSYMRNNDKAIQYTEQAIYLLNKKYAIEIPFICDLYTSLGGYYMNKGDFNTAKKHYEQCISHIEANFEQPKNMALCYVYQNYGRVFSEEKNYDKAEEYYQKSLQQLEPVLTLDPAGMYTKANLLNSIGLIYYGKEDFAKAESFFKSSIEAFESHFGKNAAVLIQQYNNYAVILQKLEKFDEAMAVTDKTLASLNADKDQFDNWLSPIEASYLIWNKAETFIDIYKKTADKSYLQKAHNEFDRYIRFLDFLRTSYREEGAKLDLASENKIAYEYGLITLFNITQNQDSLQKAFDYMEKSRALILLEAVNQSKVTDFKLPQNLMQQEDSLKNNILKLESQYTQAIQKGKNGQELEQLKSDLFLAKKQFSDFQANLEKTNPEYAQLKYGPQTIDIPTLQKKVLTSNQTLIEYFVAGKAIYITLVRRDTFVVTKSMLENPMIDDISQLREGLYGYFSNNKNGKSYSENAKIYTTTAHKLYNLLIQPIETLLTKEVVIVPDGSLGYVPFDALLQTKAGDTIVFSQLDYLAKHHIISYAQSATLWYEMMQKKHKQEPQKTLLGLAPFFYTDTEIRSKNLINSGAEMDSIGKILRGDMYLGGQANKDKLLEKANQYRIIHLSTHGNADDRVGDYSNLEFTKPDNPKLVDSLFVRDIYSLSLNADMVVLNACETGVGEIKNGEGIVSMARAFTYAGAKSIITTLWKVNDQVSAKLMSSFYKNLKSGKTKSEALWQAKLDYLKVSKGEAAHPYYWSGFIPIGDMTPIRN